MGLAHTVFLWRTAGLAYLYYYSRVPELDKVYLIRKGDAPKQPLWELLSNREHRKTLGQVLLMTSGYWIAARMTVSFAPSLLIGYLRLPPSVFSTCETVASVATIAAMIGLDMLSQRVGRRRMMMLTGASLMILETLGIYLAVEFTKSHAGFWKIGVPIVLIRVATSGPLGVMICYLNERFPTRVRSTGYIIALAMRVA